MDDMKTKVTTIVSQLLATMQLKNVEIFEKLFKEAELDGGLAMVEGEVRLTLKGVKYAEEVFGSYANQTLKELMKRPNADVLKCLLMVTSAGMLMNSIRKGKGTVNLDVAVLGYTAQALFDPGSGIDEALIAPTVDELKKIVEDAKDGPKED